MFSIRLLFLFLFCSKLDSRNFPLEIAYMEKVKDIPGVPALLDYKITDTSFCAIMVKPVNVIELFDYVLNVGILPEEVAKLIVKNVVAILLNVDKVGITHGDIRTENILIKPDTYDVYLIDFGGAMLSSEEMQFELCTHESYFPPEFVHGCGFHTEKLTTWSVGLLAYELLHEGPPFTDTLSTKYEQIGGLLSKDLSSVCKNFIISCLCKTAHRRISLQEMAVHEWICCS